MLPQETQIVTPPTPRTLANAYTLPIDEEFEKSISHHYRQRHPEQLIHLIPDLANELAAIETTEPLTSH